MEVSGFVRVMTCIGVFAIGFLGMAATDVVFPFVSESDVGDLASPASWGTETLPDNTSRVKIGYANKTQIATASADIDFAGVLVRQQKTNVILDMRDETTGGHPRKINMRGGLSFIKLDNSTAWNNANSHITLRGGEWNWNDNPIYTYVDGYNWSRYSGITISDGAVVYGVSRLQGGYANSCNTNIVTGVGTVVTTAALRVSFENGKNNMIDIADGATCVVTGTDGATLKVDVRGDADYSSNNVLRVTGGATLIKEGTGINHIGNKGADNRLYVLDGATAQIGGACYVGHYDGASGNTADRSKIVAAGTDTVLRMGAAYLGNGDGTAGSTDCTIESRDGASLRYSVVYLNGHDNGFVVSNGTLTATGDGLKVSGGTNHFVRIQGRTPSFVVEHSSTASAIVKNGFSFVYDLPAEGYADDWVPVNMGLSVSTDNTTEFVVNGVPEMMEYMRANGIRKRTLTLFKSDYAVAFTPDMVARWNARLPEGAKLSMSGSVVTLEVKVKFGVILVVR